MDPYGTPNFTVLNLATALLQITCWDLWWRYM